MIGKISSIDPPRKFQPRSYHLRPVLALASSVWPMVLADLCIWLNLGCLKVLGSLLVLTCVHLLYVCLSISIHQVLSCRHSLLITISPDQIVAHCRIIPQRSSCLVRPWDQMQRLMTMFSPVSFHMHPVLFFADQRAELPPGSTVVSVTQSGKSLWVETSRIEARHCDGSTKLYFMKVCSP